MFYATFPLRLTVQANLDNQGRLEFISTQMRIRFERDPELPALFPHFTNGELASPPWSLEDITPEGSPVGFLKLMFDGDYMTDLANANVNDPLFAKFLDQSLLHLPVKMHPVPVGHHGDDDCIYGVIVLRLAVIVV